MQEPPIFKTMPNCGPIFEDMPEPFSDDPTCKQTDTQDHLTMAEENQRLCKQTLKREGDCADWGGGIVHKGHL
jgi:hypothetical protein